MGEQHSPQPQGAQFVGTKSGSSRMSSSPLPLKVGCTSGSRNAKVQDAVWTEQSIQTISAVVGEYAAVDADQDADRDRDFARAQAVVGIGAVNFGTVLAVLVSCDIH